MPLAIGDKLGHYEILSLLGQGGMGEVYRARDLTLKREVAIKVMPATFLRDPDRRARFQREAEVLASLDHPNIGPIHGIVDSEDLRGLVLALIEGPTLADRIATGPIPCSEALPIAKQVIEALEYAHDRGVIHRDLKPANIKITPDGVVKVLDFGLAKVLEDEPPAAQTASQIENSPTLTMGHTRTGVILGTAAYMSPEQAVGRTVDRRSDIFSFGAVLYEMLTATRAFPGAAMPDVLEAVVKTDPDWSRLPSDTPGYLKNLLRRMLAKDRKQRLQAIGEARIALENPVVDASHAVVDTRPGGRLSWAWSLAALMGLAAITLGYLYFRATVATDAQAVYRLSIPLGESLPRSLALSPDGRTLAVALNVIGPGTGGIYLRALDSGELHFLSGTNDARLPFWSADGRSLGFFKDRKLSTVSAAGGPVQTLCDADANSFGGTWNRDNVILFSTATTQTNILRRVSAKGGACVDVPKQSADGSIAPVFLPDGQRFFYTQGARATQAKSPGVYLASLEDPIGVRILPDPSGVVYLPPKAGALLGHILFIRESKLMAQPFDAEKLQAQGDPFPIGADASMSNSPPVIAATAGPDGTVIYASGLNPDQQLYWVDRTGKRLEAASPVLTGGLPHAVTLSPDQQSVAYSSATITAANQAALWLHELSRPVEQRSKLVAAFVSGVWSSDSRTLVYGVGPRLYRKSANGGAEQLLWEDRAPTEAPANGTENDKIPTDMSPDGHSLVYAEIDPKSGADLWILPEPLGSTPAVQKPVPFLKTAFNEGDAQISPDGHWVAYRSDESGKNEIYIRPFPTGEAKVQISVQGGILPRWRRDGKELFYNAPNVGSRAIMATKINWKPNPVPETPQLLFRIPTLGFGYGNAWIYSASADGQRFLISAYVAEPQPVVHVLLNWNGQPGK